MMIALEGVPYAAGKATHYGETQLVCKEQRDSTYAMVLTMRAVHMPPNHTAS